MSEISKQFIQLALDKNALKFGEFKLKSGRISPYFFNAGLFDDGQSLALLGELYAKSIHSSGVQFDMLYGPAYKGIPLATTIAVAYSHLYQINLPVCFNRKEKKQHGEGGQLIGAPLLGKVLIVDDVVSAGTSVRESIQIIEQANASAVGISVAIDRMEKGQGDLSAMQELKQTFGLNTLSIARLDSLLDFIKNDSDLYHKMLAYRKKYGVK